MKTYAENFLARIQDARGRAVRLAAGSYTDRDMEKLVESIGADLELFLKTAVYGGSARNGIAECISGLAGFGVRRVDIESLHRLRLAYNRAKHQPGTTLTFHEADKLLEDTAAAVLAFQAAGIARVNDSEPMQAVRHFWLIAGENLMFSEVELRIYLPTPDVDFPPSLDVVFIGAGGWQQAERELASAGALRTGPGSIPDRVFEAWSREKRVVLIGSWTGQYRDLLRALLPYERARSTYLPLARGDDFLGALSSILMAAVDLGREGLLAGDEDEVRAALLAAAETSHSIPPSAPTPKLAAEVTAQGLARLSAEHRLELSGPFWRSKEDLAAARSSARVVGEGELFVVADDGRLLAFSGH